MAKGEEAATADPRAGLKESKEQKEGSGMRTDAVLVGRRGDGEGW